MDADNTSVSMGTRVEAAYDATFNMALAVINASGWRHRAVPGHHAFVLEAACESIGAKEALFDRLDAIRELRNQKYDGIARTAADLVDIKKVYQQFSALVECVFRRNVTADSGNVTGHSGDGDRSIPGT